MNNQNCCLEHFILLLNYIPGKGEFIFPRLLLDLFFIKQKIKNEINRSALMPPSAHQRECRHRIQPQFSILPSVQLKHVQNGVVHLGEHSQVDRQAGLAILSGWRACEPGKSIVLLQNKPEHIGGGLRVEGVRVPLGLI